MRFWWKLLKLEWMFFKLSAIADLQMRFNLVLHFLNDTLWYAVQIALFEALYLHVDQLGGWGLPETRVFLGVLFVVDSLQMILFCRNFENFPERVARGEIELLLLKPVSSQQLMTAQRLQCGFLPNFCFAMVWLVWSLMHLPGGFLWSHLLALLVTIPLALSIFYSTRVIVSTCALVFTRADQIQELYFALFRLGQRPDRLYGSGMRYLVLMIVPVGMIASVPTRLLVDPFESWVLAALVATSISFLWIANRFWHWAIRRHDQR